MTTFTAPAILASGTGVYTGIESGVEPGFIGPTSTPPTAPNASGSIPPPEVQRGGLNVALWGGYSATVVDPSNPNAFWTFQQITDSQFSSDTNTWAVQATRISIDQPAITLSVSAPAAAVTPLRLGVMGDDLSAGSTTDPSPGWVAQLKASGDFTVPVGANQAVDGALAAGLASQLPEMQTLAASLNYTAIMIGENDALALVKGTETAAQYTSNIEGIESTLSTLQTQAPNDHLILVTVPDIFVTPEVEGMTSLTAATIAADKTIIQTANAAITQYAVTHGIPVIDLFAAYDGLLKSGSLSLGGVTFTSTSTTNPLFASDTFNPSAVVQGLIANMVIEAADVGYAADLTPLSDEQLLTNVGATATVTGTTYDNLTPYVLPSDANPAFNSETVTATLSQASAHDVVVNLSYAGSVPGTDFLTSGNSIVILAGQTSGSITLTGVGEPAALTVIGITSLEGAVENTPQTVTAVLTNPPSIVTLALSSPSFPEDGSVAETVTANLSSPSLSGTVVNLTFGGSASPGIDYTASGESIYIPAGSSSGSITLTGNDNLIATNEMVTITMASVTGAYSQVPQSITAILTAPPPTSASISGTVVESTAGNPGMPGVTVYIDENGNGIFEPSAGPGILADPFETTSATGTYTFSGLSPGNYTLREVVPAGFQETAPVGGSTTETLTPGLQVTNVNFINMPPVASTIITLTATDLSGNTLGSPSFSENDGQIHIVATLPSAATNNVVINLTFGGTAVAGVDYFASSQSIFIPAGSTTGSITLTGLAVGVDKSNPTVTIGIGSVMNGTPSASSVTATILEQNDVLQGVLSGMVFQDNNYNAVQDSGEPNLANAIIYIGSSAGFNPNTSPFTFSGTTGSTLGLGNFAFDGLTPANYNIFQAPPANMTQTGPPNAAHQPDVLLQRRHDDSAGHGTRLQRRNFHQPDRDDESLNSHRRLQRRHGDVDRQPRQDDADHGHGGRQGERHRPLRRLLDRSHWRRQYFAHQQQ